MTPLVQVTVTAPRVAPIGAIAVQSRNPTKPLSDFDRLVSQPRADADFQRLMQKEFTPKGRAPIEEVKVTARKSSKFFKAGRALSRLSGAASMLFTANDLANALLSWNKRNFSRKSEKALKQVPRSSDNPLRIQPTNGFARNAQALEEIYVIATKTPRNNPRATSYSQLLASARSNSRQPRPSTATRTVRAGGQSPSPSTRQRTPSIRDALTSLNEAGVGFTPKTQTQRARPPADRDTCTRVRSPRPACPARGYKLVCKQWSKKSCR